MAMTNSLFNSEDNELIHRYWRDKVEVDRERLLKAKEHIPAYEIRHEYTNYDDLINLPKVVFLDPIQKGRVISIIKYQCTSQAIQCVNWEIRRQVKELRIAVEKLEADVNQRDGFIEWLKEILWGKDKEIKRLKTQLEKIKAEALREKYDQDRKKLIRDLQKNLDRLRKKNMEMGGKLSHYNRIKQERDDYRTLANKLEIEVVQLKKELSALETKLVEYKAMRTNLGKQIEELKQEIGSLEEEIRRLKGEG